MVVDPDGNQWVRAEEICGLGPTCPHSRHNYDDETAEPVALLGRNVTCKMVRAWANDPKYGITPMRVRRATWYRLDQLRAAEARAAAALEAGKGMPRQAQS